MTVGPSVLWVRTGAGAWVLAACEAAAAKWTDPEGDDGAPIPARRLRLNLRNWVAVTTANGQACAEWATRGDERRNTADSGEWPCHFAGCVSNCPWGRCGRGGLDFLALVHSAARRLGGAAACRAVSSPAQWQRPRKWSCARAPHRATKPSWGSDAQAELMRISSLSVTQVSVKKVITKKPFLVRGPGVWSARSRGGGSKDRPRSWFARARGSALSQPHKRQPRGCELYCELGHRSNAFSSRPPLGLAHHRHRDFFFNPDPPPRQATDVDCFARLPVGSNSKTNARST